MPAKKSEGFILLFFCIFFGAMFAYLAIRGEMVPDGASGAYFWWFAAFGGISLILGIIRGIYLVTDYKKTGTHIDCLQGDASVEISQQMTFGQYFRLVFVSFRTSSMFLIMAVVPTLVFMLLSRDTANTQKLFLLLAVMGAIALIASVMTQLRYFKAYYPIRAIIYAEGLLLNDSIKVPWKMVYKIHRRGDYLILDMHSQFKLVLTERQCAVGNGRREPLSKVIEHYLNLRNL